MAVNVGIPDSLTGWWRSSAFSIYLCTPCNRLVTNYSRTRNLSAEYQVLLLLQYYYKVNLTYTLIIII